MLIQTYFGPITDLSSLALLLGYVATVWALVLFTLRHNENLTSTEGFNEKLGRDPLETEMFKRLIITDYATNSYFIDPWVEARVKAANEYNAKRIEVLEKFLELLEYYYSPAYLRSRPSHWFKGEVLGTILARLRNGLSPRSQASEPSLLSQLESTIHRPVSFATSPSLPGLINSPW